MELKSKKNLLAVIIPMYNEEIVAAKCIDEVQKILKKVKQKTILIVINDGSTDATEKIVLAKQKQYRKQLEVVTYKKNKGYGGASEAGIKKAIQLHYEWCLHMDSDLTNDPKFIPQFIKAISPDVDCIKASRYIQNGKVINVPLFRRFVSLIGNYAASLLFNVGIRDCTNGFRMVRLEKIKGVHFKENNFSIILEELYYLKKRHARFKEIPNILTARTNSTSHFTYTPKIFYDYFKYVIKSALIF
jgi:dolichol-phosphate mannosyltransferase